MRLYVSAIEDGRMGVTLEADAERVESGIHFFGVRGCRSLRRSMLRMQGSWVVSSFAGPCKAAIADDQADLSF
jgi:hypothetical protein